MRAMQHHQHGDSVVTCKQPASIRRQLQQERRSVLFQASTALRSAGWRPRSGSACTAQAFPERDRRPVKVVERTEKDVALESMQLESELREKVSTAVENLGYRVRCAPATLLSAMSDTFCFTLASKYPTRILR